MSSQIYADVGMPVPGMEHQPDWEKIQNPRFREVTHENGFGTIRRYVEGKGEKTEIRRCATCKNVARELVLGDCFDCYNVKHRAKNEQRGTL